MHKRKRDRHFAKKTQTEDKFLFLCFGCFFSQTQKYGRNPHDQNMSNVDEDEEKHRQQRRRRHKGKKQSDSEDDPPPPLKKRRKSCGDGCCARQTRLHVLCLDCVSVSLLIAVILAAAMGLTFFASAPYSSNQLSLTTSASFLPSSSTTTNVPTMSVTGTIACLSTHPPSITSFSVPTNPQPGMGVVFSTTLSSTLLNIIGGISISTYVLVGLGVWLGGFLFLLFMTLTNMAIQKRRYQTDEELFQKHNKQHDRLEPIQIQIHEEEENDKPKSLGFWRSCCPMPCFGCLWTWCKSVAVFRVLMSRFCLYLTVSIGIWYGILLGLYFVFGSTQVNNISGGGLSETTQYKNATLVIPSLPAGCTSGPISIAFQSLTIVVPNFNSDISLASSGSNSLFLDIYFIAPIVVVVIAILVIIQWKPKMFGWLRFLCCCCRAPKQKDKEPKKKRQTTITMKKDRDRDSPVSV